MCCHFTTIQGLEDLLSAVATVEAIVEGTDADSERVDSSHLTIKLRKQACQPSMLAFSWSLRCMISEHSEYSKPSYSKEATSIEQRC